MRRLGRHPWLVVSVLAMIGVAVLLAFPFRAWVDQGNQREALAARAAELAAANAALEEQAALLGSDEVIELLARQRYQLVKPGEEAFAILPDGQPPATVPSRATPPEPEPEAKGPLGRAWSWVTGLL